MEKVKNQHYVPKSYLKYFANSKEQLWVYDKELDRKFPANINKVASEGYFYDIPYDEVQSAMTQEDKEKVLEILSEANFASELEMKHAVEQSVEKFFSEQIEGDFKKILDGIRARYKMMVSPFNSQVLSQNECQQLSLMLAFQIVRSKEFRQSFIESKKSMTQAMVDIFASSIDKEYKPGSLTASQKHEFESLEHAAIIFGELPLRLADVLASHIWFIGVNKTEQPFYTSDHPIVKRAHYQDPILGTSGYGSEGIEIAFPISNELILILAERSFHNGLLGAERHFIPMVDVQNIVYYNSLQVYQSNRQIYCIDDKFDLIKQMRDKEGPLNRKPKKLVANSFLGENVY